MAFTITTSNGGTSATVVGTNSSDAIAAAALANINTLSLTAFAADDAVFTGTTALAGGSSLTPSTISLGQGDDLITLGAGITASGSLVDLGEGADTFTSGGFGLTGVSIKGFGGLDTINLGASALTSVFLNGNEGTDRFTINGVLTNSTIAGGSEDDVINLGGGAASLLTSRVNGQNGDDTINVTNALYTQTGSTIFGGQGNDTLTATDQTAGSAGRVVFSGDLGNDRLIGIAQVVDAQGDVLFGGDGNDLLTASGGADTMSGGDGVDTFAFAIAGAAGSGVYTTMLTGVASGATVSAGDVFTLNNPAQALAAPAPLFNGRVTNITGFSSVDVLDTTNGTNAASATGVAIDLTTVAGQALIGTAGVTYKIAGVYNQADTSFTVTDDNLGTDTLIVLDGGVNSQGNIVLLKGTSAKSLVASNFV